MEIIVNDQGNRHVAFTDTERLIGDPARKQVNWLETSILTMEEGIFEVKTLTVVWLITLSTSSSASTRRT